MRELLRKIWYVYMPVALIAMIVGGFFYFYHSAEKANAAWYASGGTWGYRRQLTIDHNRVSTVNKTTLSSFPVVISFTDSDFKYTGSGGKMGRSDGLDMVFTSSDGTTKLDYELESYSSTTGKFIAWVRIPTLIATADTVIYMYYGNASSGDQSNKTGVWDSNFKGVWHMADNAANTTIVDSTSNANNGTNVANASTKQTPGQVDGALTYNGSSDHTTITRNAGLEPASVTLCTWAQPTNNETTYASIVDKEYSNPRGSPYVGYKWDAAYTTNKYTFEYGLAGGLQAVQTSFSPSVGTTVYLCGTYDGTTAKTYVNGVPDNTSSVSGSLVYNSTGNLFFGSNSDGNEQFTGIIDEVRISNTVRSADWIKTEYNNQLAINGGFVALGGRQLASRPAATAGESVANRGWYNSAWPYRMSITINHAKVASSTSTTLNNFPVLISVTNANLKSTGNGGYVGQTSGADIVFTDSDGSAKLAHEIESYDPTTGQLIAWVNVPVVSALQDHVIYVYYGNASAADQSNKTGVWDSDYKAVYHLNDTTTSTVSDSTASPANGTKRAAGAPAQASAQIGYGQQFTNTNKDYINAGTPTKLNFTGSDFTISGWMKMQTANTYRSVIWKGDGNTDTSLNYFFETNSSGNMRIGYANSGSYYALDSTSVLSTGSWYYVVATYVNSTKTLSMYVNGASAATPAVQGASPSSTNSNPVVIGGCSINTASICDNINGYLDEVRVSTAARSADWIATEYNNQNSPSTFVTFGSQQTPATAVPANVWYNASWVYRKQITIDHRKVSTVNGTSLNNFPFVFVVTDADLKYTGSGGKMGRSDGLDMVFTAADGITKLDYDLDYYSSATGQVIAWVRVPMLSSAADTVVYVYYGNAAASDQSNKTGTWNNGYKGVWHLTDPTNPIDSTGVNNGTNHGSSATTGQIYGGANFYQTYITVPRSTSLEPSTISYSFWFKRNGSQGNYGRILQKGIDQAPPYASYAASFVGTDPSNLSVFLGFNDGSNDTWASGTGVIADNTWYYITMTYDGSTVNAYKNGVSVYSHANNKTLNYDSTNLILGGSEASAGNYDTNTWYGGILDEVRVSNTARSADWVATEYNNQVSPSTFFAYGARSVNGRQSTAGVPLPEIKIRGKVKFR